MNSCSHIKVILVGYFQVLLSSMVDRDLLSFLANEIELSPFIFDFIEKWSINSS